MNEPRKPLFGFLWPKPDPNAPVDDAYRQVRKVRITPRGPIRIAALIVATAVMVSTTGSFMLAAVTAGLSPTTLIGAALTATILVAILRGWVVGTYVTDAGLSIDLTWRRIIVPWEEIAAIECHEQSAPFLGLPVRVAAMRSSAVLIDGRVLPTHVYATSPDVWLRPEAFDMARIRLERWQARD
jgi:hypothetical protein